MENSVEKNFIKPVFHIPVLISSGAEKMLSLVKAVKCVDRSDFALILDILDDILYQILEVRILFHSLGHACY